MKTPNLVNAVEMSELSKDFEVLPHDIRYFLLHTGDYAKVCVPFEEHNGYNGERFWVEIISAEPGRYIGRIDNDLSHSERHGLYCDDEIPFTYLHVYQIWHRSKIEEARQKLKGTKPSSST